MTDSVPSASEAPPAKHAHQTSRDPAKITRSQIAKLLATGETFTMPELQHLTGESADGVQAAVEALIADGLVITCRRVRTFKLLSNGEES